MLFLGFIKGFLGFVGDLGRAVGFARCRRLI